MKIKGDDIHHYAKYLTKKQLCISNCCSYCCGLDSVLLPETQKIKNHRKSLMSVSYFLSNNKRPRF